MPRDDAAIAFEDRPAPGGPAPVPRPLRRLTVDSTDAGGALIGPNAILQLLPVLDDALGAEARHALLDRAGVPVPSGRCMIPQAQVAAAHQRLRAELGPRAAGLAARAGRLTAEYILAHRIPAAARALLRALPPPAAARLLSKAIAQHAWTFAGSGRLVLEAPTRFVLHDNPVIADERGDAPLCNWHAAVFETLYRRLVAPQARCRETTCAATGAVACTFRVTF